MVLFSSSRLTPPGWNTLLLLGSPFCSSASQVHNPSWVLITILHWVHGTYGTNLPPFMDNAIGFSLDAFLLDSLFYYGFFTDLTPSGHQILVRRLQHHHADGHSAPSMPTTAWIHLCWTRSRDKTATFTILWVAMLVPTHNTAPSYGHH